MSENQKLREAFEAYITDNGKWPNAILKAPGGQYLLLRTSVAWQDWKACAEALALPTADHIPDAGEMVADHLPDAGKMIETAAPVGEREAFENEMRYVDVWGHRSLKKRASGNYENWQVNLMWDVWQARSALSASDAVDAQRYRWLREQHWSNSDICCVDEPKQNVRLGGTCPSGDLLDSAIDAAMRKDKP